MTSMLGNFFEMGEAVDAMVDLAGYREAMAP
jgi:hypothetical protein